MITLERVGRRTYLRGDTYNIKDRLREAGAHWDAVQRAWWIGSELRARELVESAPAPRNDAGERMPEKLSDESEVKGRALYQGRTYLLLWSGTTPRGHAAKLASMDGARVFWADCAAVTITHLYERRDQWGSGNARPRGPMTFGKLQGLRERYARARAQGHSDGIATGQRYECSECGEWVTRGTGNCFETGAAH